MTGRSEIQRYLGVVREGAKFVESAGGRKLRIHSVAEGVTIVDGMKVSFYDHHDKDGNSAADVREVHTKPTPSLSRAGILTK